MRIQCAWATAIASVAIVTCSMTAAQAFGEVEEGFARGKAVEETVTDGKIMCEEGWEGGIFVARKSAWHSWLIK